MPSRQSIAWLWVILAVAISPAHAQLCHDNATVGTRRHQVGIFAGYSPDSVTLFGTAADRKLVLAGVNYSYLCRVWGATSISYTGSLAPAAIAIQPRRAPHRAVYGFAAMPLGFRFDFLRERKVHPFAETELGLIASTHPIPIEAPNATGLNFVVTGGAGVRWKTAERQDARFGYKFFHISNAGTTNFNPGVDNNVLYAGYWIHF